MTVNTDDNKVTYAGDGATAVYSTDFSFAADSEVDVLVVTDATGDETPWVNGTQYTLTGAGTGSAGELTVDFSPTDYRPVAGETLVIQLLPAFTQATKLPRGGTLSPKDTLEPMYDKLLRQILRLKDQVDLSLKASTAETSIAALPNVLNRANKFFKFDENGDPAVDTSVGANQGAWVTATAYVVNDIVNTGSPASSYICAEAHTSGVFATDLAANKWAVLAAAGDTGATGAAGSNGTNGTDGDVTTQAAPVVDNTLVRWSGTDGTTIQESSWTLSDAELMTAAGALDMADNEINRAILKDIAHEISAIGNSTTTTTIDIEDGNYFTVTANADPSTLAISNPIASGDASILILEITNGGSITWNWPASIAHPADTAPTLTAAGRDLFGLVTRDGGTIWNLFTIGLDV